MTKEDGIFVGAKWHLHAQFFKFVCVFFLGCVCVCVCVFVFLLFVCVSEFFIIKSCLFRDKGLKVYSIGIYTNGDGGAWNRLEV
jgi:hypothetical protein